MTDLPALPTNAGDSSILVNKDQFEQVQRAALMFASSDLAPEQYRIKNLADPAEVRRKTANCFLAVQRAAALEVPTMVFLEASYVVHGRVGIGSSFVIGLINARGGFGGPLRWEAVGVKGQDSYGFKAIARTKAGDLVEGPEVTMGMARAEGWVRNEKYRTMPDLMLRYRAASMFASLYCPELKAGLRTTEELEDMAASGALPAIAAQDPIQALQARVDAAAPPSPLPEPAPAQEPQDAADGEPFTTEEGLN